MRKVILGVAISLDGFIEGANGEFDWCPPPSQTEMGAFLERIDTLFFGRKSFELMGITAFPGKKYYVFSNSLKKIEGDNIHLIGGDVVNKVVSIKKESGKDIWFFGGANLATTLINAGLVDELWLGLVPVLLGKGKPLFQNIEQRQHFSLMRSTPNEGYISMIYKYEGELKSKTN